MSLEPETLKKLVEAQKDTLDLVNKILDALTTLKEELKDTIADNHDELLKKLHELDTFCRNILEKNQKTIWIKLLEVEGEEVEQPTKPEP